MAGLGSRGSAFHYGSRSSAARGWDIRFRVAAIAVISATVLGAPPLCLIALGILVGILLALAGSSVKEVGRVIRGFLGFLGFFFVLGVIFEPTVAQAWFLVTQGVRLLLLLLLGHFLFLTATPSDVTEGIRWYLGWLGRRRAWMAANMAAWALSSVPLAMDQASSLTDAAALRGWVPQKHPFQTIRILTLALLVRTVGRSTDMVEALEARNLGYSVPPSEGQSSWKDWVALVLVGVWLGASWVLVPGGILIP